MLVVAEPAAKSRGRRDNDPVMEAFLSFLAADMARSPQQIQPMDRALSGRIEALVSDLAVDPDEDLGDDPLI